jgi:hypothetical protein
MRRKMFCIATLVTMMLIVGASVSADVKRIAYPQIKVELTPAYTPDAAFNSFRTEFIDSVARKDAKALFTLVAPGFLWTVNNNLASDFDPGRDAQHNFRVVFGFRALGSIADGEVEGGPFWDNLAAFANESTYYQSTEGRNLVCSPVAASIIDEEVFKQVRAKIETPGEGADWYFIVRSTAVTIAPGDKGAPIATLGLEAVPVLSTYPLPDSGAAPTHYEVLLPSGRVGWIPANAARPFQADQLCYALTAKGEWKIAIYDSAE